MPKYLPNAITLFRLGLAPLVAYYLYSYQLTIAFVLLAAVLLSDFLDGQLARRLDATSILGTYLDITADFAVIFFAYLSLALQSLIPIWIVGLMAVMFLQFLLSSLKTKVFFDPIGKPYGAILMFFLVLLTVFPDLKLLQVIYSSIVSLSLLVLISRYSSRFKGGTYAG